MIRRLRRRRQRRTARSLGGRCRGGAAGIGSPLSSGCVGRRDATGRAAPTSAGSRGAGLVAHSGSEATAAPLPLRALARLLAPPSAASMRRRTLVPSRPAASLSVSPSALADQLVPAAGGRAVLALEAGDVEPVARRASCATYSSRLRSSVSRAHARRAWRPRSASMPLVPLTGHTNGCRRRLAAARISSRSQRASPRGRPMAVEQVSGRNTIGASRPLAPCTVMTRTSSRPCSMSRLISRSPSRSQVRKPVQRGRRVVVVGSAPG